jgi:hypothetical protein
MAPRSLIAVAVAAILALSACGDREPGSTTGPQLAGGGNTSACGFSNSLITSYFPSSRQGKILTLKQSMANAGQGTPNARTFGFEIMDSIGSVSRSFSVDPAAGAQLTIAIIACMFDEASSFTYPENSAISAFTAALNSAAGGAYYVRGGGREGTVLGTSHPLGGAAVNLSGIEPLAGNWTDMVKLVDGENLSEGRALLYGYSVPGSSALVYDWASVPSALTFDPAIVVAVCDNDLSQTGMVHEEDIGVLAYVETGMCDEDTQSLTKMDAGWGPRALASRLGRMLVGVVVPEPLQATVLLTRGGGTTTTVPKSKFGRRTVKTLTLAWIQGRTPPAVVKGTDNPLTVNQENAFPVSFTVATEAGDPIAGTCGYLTGTNNNGTPTMLTGPRDQEHCTTPPNGDTSALSVLLTTEIISGKTVSVANFGQVAVTKPGGIVFNGVADVIGRDGFGSILLKSNVKPAGK